MHDPSTDPPPFVRTDVDPSPAPVAATTDDNPRTMEAIIADLTTKVAELSDEKSEWEHERAIYQDERTKLLDAFDKQRQQLAEADRTISDLQAVIAAGAAGAAGAANPPEVV